MYEQYTDKQIVEMLVPKLKKLCPYYDWNDYLNGEGYETWLHFVATLYKSAYIRGQLGRSFIIGKPKQTEHWVPATKDNVKIGSKVRMIEETVHKGDPQWFPDVETEGTVTEVGFHVHLIQWPKGTTSGTDEWYCADTRLEVLLCE